MAAKIFIVEGYSLDAIEYFLTCLKSLHPKQKYDAYIRLCKIALKIPKSFPSENDIESLCNDVRFNLLRLLMQENDKT